jgi:hypothetical protein
LLSERFFQSEHNHPSGAYPTIILAVAISALQQDDILKKPERISAFDSRRPEFDKPRILVD